VYVRVCVCVCVCVYVRVRQYALYSVDYCHFFVFVPTTICAKKTGAMQKSFIVYY